ncbi:MAG TPA: hypothetical protein VLL28_06510, partial [Hyphomicrobiaceae bacterium]|nr:hypothetical protein [Hyphomicrobiaceae bacterium]
TFADGFVDSGARYDNLIGFGRAMHFDFVGDKETGFRAVVVIERFLKLAAEIAGVFEDGLIGCLGSLAQSPGAGECRL